MLTVTVTCTAHHGVETTATTYPSMVRMTPALGHQRTVGRAQSRACACSEAKRREAVVPVMRPDESLCACAHDGWVTWAEPRQALSED